MRITTSMMMGNFGSTLENRLSDIDTLAQQLSSQRSFLRASDDPASASEALGTNHDVVVNEQYQSSCTMANSWVSATESAVKTVNDILTSAKSAATQANNGTNSTADCSSYAESFKNYQQQILTTLNSSFGDRYIFGEGVEGNPPFKVGDGTAADGGAATQGKLLYYDYNNTKTYLPVEGLTSSTINSTNLSMPIDLGMGMQMSASGTVQPGTCFNGATSAFSFLCDNLTSTGCSDIYDQMQSAVNDLNSNSTASMGSLITDIKTAQNSVLSTNVDIGENQKMLNFIGDKLTNNETDLTARLSSLMDVDSTQAIMQYNVKQMVYKSALSISQTILQPTLIDFLK